MTSREVLGIAVDTIDPLSLANALIELLTEYKALKNPVVDEPEEGEKENTENQGMFASFSKMFSSKKPKAEADGQSVEGDASQGQPDAKAAQEGQQEKAEVPSGQPNPPEADAKAAQEGQQEQAEVPSGQPNPPEADAKDAQEGQQEKAEVPSGQPNPPEADAKGAQEDQQEKAEDQAEGKSETPPPAQAKDETKESVDPEFGVKPEDVNKDPKGGTGKRKLYTKKKIVVRSLKKKNK